MRAIGVLLLALGCEAATMELPLQPPPTAPRPDAGRTPRPTRPDASTPDASMPGMLLPAELQPRVIDFGEVQIGLSGTAGLIASNPNHPARVRVTIVSELADAIEVSVGSVSIEPGASRRFELRFTPVSAGPHTSEILLDACADDGCFVQVLLVGLGVDPNPRPDAGVPNPCGNAGPCPSMLTFGPVPVGTTALWNFYCSCPEASNYSMAEIDPPVEGASLRRLDMSRLFLSFTASTAGEFGTNIIFREGQSQLIVPLVLIAE